jgi:hypothetical protein
VSRFGGEATIVPASDYVSTFGAMGVRARCRFLPVGQRFNVSLRWTSERDVALPVGQRFNVMRRRSWGPGGIWWRLRFDALSVEEG